jgi:uncharacterized membrane protein YozB (DUF420 family)
MQTETSAIIGESAPAAPRTRPHGERFFAGMAIVAALAVFLGFGRTYYLKSIFPTPSFPILFHIHGALFTAWMLLLVLQTWLVASRRTALHRRVGRIGLFLVVLMLVTGSLVSFAGARGDGPIRAAMARGERPAVDVLAPLEVLAINLKGMLLFGVFAGAGLWFRRRPDVHKRFMMLATLVLLPPALGRATIHVFGAPKPVLSFGATSLLLVALMIYDRRTRGRLHPVTLWAGLGLLASFPAGRAIGQTDLWLDFASWLIH